MPPEECKEKKFMMVFLAKYLIIDTNKQGYIPLDEAKAFYKVIAPEMTEAEVFACL